VIRVLIVDDEAPSRVRLRQLLSAHDDIEIVGEAETGPEAIRLTSSLEPDLLLLDVQMPGASGIDVAAGLGSAGKPHIVFCTAFEQHAVDAFELNAVDYLLKPVSRARLKQALDRVRSNGPVDRPRASGNGRFLVRDKDHYLVVGETKVLCFCADGGVTRLICENGQFWMDPTLNDLEQRTDRKRFFRISRSALVSLNAVTEVHPLPGGSGEALLKNGQRIEVSRRRFREFLEALGHG
jgi:two-component system, LytTR family, response regulator